MANQEPSVTLRPLRSEDVDAFLNWAGDPEVTKSLFWEPHTDREKAREFLKAVAEPHRWFMAICLDGTPVGAITLDVRTGSGAQRAELGYVLAKAHWGKGIATEAVKLALARGFKDLNIVRIEALVDPENFGSVNVLKKAGMVQEAYFKKYLVHRGRVRDRLVFAYTV